MKLMRIFALIGCILIIACFISIWQFEKSVFNSLNIEKPKNIVDITLFNNTSCIECTTLDWYLEVYKKAWVNFWNIRKIDYKSWEWKTHSQEYDVKKLPFIIFSKELSQYETISNSWDRTFGYKNNEWEFIPTDIIPPYFDIKSQKIEGLIDMIYIWNDSCEKCYTLNNIQSILSQFWLKFQNIKVHDNNWKIAKELIKKYNIEVSPVIILSAETNLYKNFAYFWKSIWTIEEDGKYILRKPNLIGLKYK